MQVLPIRSLDNVDKEIFGSAWVNLAHLARSGFPVVEGVLVELSTDMESFIPSSLSLELKGVKSYLWQNKIYKDEIKLWKDLAKDKKALAIQAIFFLDKNYPLITAFFDPDLKEVVIKTEAKLSPQSLRKIDQLVTQVKRKLAFPQVLEIILAKEPLILKLSPFTHNVPLDQKKVSTSGINLVSEIKSIKSAVQVFYDSQGEIPQGIDGIYFEDLNNLNFDDKVLLLGKMAEEFSGPIIYQLPNIQDDDLGGTLRLVEQNSLLVNTADAFLFARNKKNLLGLELAIPKVRAPEEYLQIKRDLAVRGITRKGTLKFWLEFSVPENVINVSSYVMAGMDGVILDLKNLHQMLIGFDHKRGEDYILNKTLIEFIVPAIRALHRANTPILVRLRDSIDSEVLGKLVEVGVKGIIVGNRNEAESLSEHLNWLEKRIISRRFLS